MNIFRIVVFIITLICLFTTTTVMGLIGYDYKSWETIAVVASMIIMSLANYYEGLCNK